MTKKKTTNQLVEDLARAVQKGFVEVKEEFKEVRQEIKELDQKVDKRFDKVEERLDRIEGFVTGHGNRLDRLEDNMLVVKTKVGIR